MNKKLLYKNIEQEFKLDINTLLEDGALNNIYEYKNIQNIIDYENFEKYIFNRILTKNFNQIESFFLNNQNNIEILDEEANKIFSQWIQIEKLYDNAEERLKEVLTKDEFVIFKQRLNDISNLNQYFQENILQNKIKQINAQTLFDYQRIFFNNEEIMDKIFYKKENLTDSDIRFYHFFKHISEFFGQGLTSEIAAAYLTYIQAGKFDQDYQNNNLNIKDLINNNDVEEAKNVLETLVCQSMSQTLVYKAEHTKENSGSVMYFANTNKQWLNQRAGPGQMDITIPSSIKQNHYHITEVTSNRAFDDIYNHAKNLPEKIMAIAAMGESLGYTFTINLGFKSFKEEEIKDIIHNKENLELNDYINKMKDLLTFAIPESYIDSINYNQENIEINLFAFGNKIKKFEKDHSYKHVLLFLQEINKENIDNKIIPKFLPELINSINRVIDIETREDIANIYFPKIHSLLEEVQDKFLFESDQIDTSIRNLEFRVDPKNIEENLNKAAIKKVKNLISYEKSKDKQKEYGLFSGDSLFIESVTNLGYSSKLAKEVIETSSFFHNEALNQGKIDYYNNENNPPLLRALCYVDLNRGAQGPKPKDLRHTRTALIIGAKNVKGNYTAPYSFLPGVSQPTSAIKVNKNRILERLVENLTEIGKESKTDFNYYGQYGFKNLMNETINICQTIQEIRLHDLGYRDIETGHDLYNQIEHIQKFLIEKNNKIENIIENTYNIEEEINKKTELNLKNAITCIKNFKSSELKQEDRDNLYTEVQLILKNKSSPKKNKNIKQKTH